MKELSTIFSKLKSILEHYTEDFQARKEYIGSKAKTKKPGYHLYGKKEVSLFRKKPQPTYVAGVIQQKNYVSFYLSPIYSHPELLLEVSTELKKFLKGKSCFNLKILTPELEQEIEEILVKGIDKYKEIEWV